MICPVLIRFLRQMDIWSSSCEQFCAESDDFRKKEQRKRERANIIPGKRHLFDGGRQRCTKERTTSISSRRHQFGGGNTLEPDGRL